MDRTLDIAAQFNNHLVVAPAVFDFIIERPPAELLYKFKVFFYSQQIWVNVVDLCLPFDRVESRFKDLFFFWLFK